MPRDGAVVGGVGESGVCVTDTMADDGASESPAQFQQALLRSIYEDVIRSTSMGE